MDAIGIGWFPCESVFCVFCSHFFYITRTYRPSFQIYNEYSAIYVYTRPGLKISQNIFQHNMINDALEPILFAQALQIDCMQKQIFRSVRFCRWFYVVG